MGLRRQIADGIPARSRLQRLELRRAAARYAAHGWPVIPGARLAGTRFTCGLGCQTVSVHPAMQPWEAHATTDVTLVATIWRRRPYSVLLATGIAFDVLEVPAYIGAGAARAVRGPVAVTPTGRWMFLVRPGAELRPELALHHDVVLHGRHSWIPAPPVRTPLGRVRWSIGPQETEWRLPQPARVQEALLATSRRNLSRGEARLA